MTEYDIPPKALTENYTLVSFSTPVPSRSQQRSRWQIHRELGHGGYSITTLILTTAQATQVPVAVHEDLDDDSEMWKMFLDEVKEEDSRFTDAWKEDANSIIVFVSFNRLVPVFISMTISKTGLFSAIVGAFIIEFYKKLSSDSGDQTVALLRQISHQLPNSPNTTSSNTANQSSSPGTAMVWANILWLISLVLSLTCALIATLLQQWARRYIETPKSSNVQRHRARVRSLLLIGTKLYKIPLIVEMLPTLLHLSVYLFLAGLVIAFHTIHEKVAVAVDVAVGVSGLAYLALSILPCLDVRCPYRTPISQILWYPIYAFLSFAAPFLNRCITGLRGLLNRPAQSRALTVSNHWQYFTDGLEKTIFYRAVTTLRDGDRGRVAWLFNQLALGDRHTFLKFAASIPIHKIPDLIPSIESVPFLESLLVLLRIVAGIRPGSAAWLDSDVHRRSLLVCLHAICHIAKANAATAADLDFMRDHFADTALMRGLWDDDDNSIRITSRSICALITRQVVRKPWLKEEDLYWLGEVTGSSSNAILEADVTVRDQMNFKSFVFGVLSSHVTHLSTKDTTLFNETLAILLGIRTDGNYFTTSEWQIRLSEEVGRIQQYDPEGGREILNKLRLIFPTLPAVHSVDAIPIPDGFPPPQAVSHPHVTFPPRAPSPSRAFPPSRASSPSHAPSPSRAASPPRVLPQPPHRLLPRTSNAPPPPLRRVAPFRFQPLLPK